MDTSIKPKTTPKDFFLWLGAIVTLYVSATALILLIHQYIDVYFPNSLISYGDPYSGTIRFAIASLVVMYPLLVWILHTLHKDINTAPEKKELWVRRWLVFLTLFIAGLTMAIDIISIVYVYLQGDLSIRFILKALTVLVILGAGFMYFLHELRGTWEKKPGLSKSIGAVVSLIVLVSVAASFFIIGSPESARLRKIDDQKIMDLQTIQYQIINYWQQKGKLPVSIKEMEDPLTGFSAPLDPETAQAYGYRITSAPYSFEVCADFNLEVKENIPDTSRPIAPMGVYTGNDTWDHGVGQTCFERTIDPERFPVLPK